MNEQTERRCGDRRRSRPAYGSRSTTDQLRDRSAGGMRNLWLRRQLLAASPNGTAAVSYVYAIGRVEARFPNLAAEKEFAQATGRTDTAGKTDQQTFHAVLSKRENRYLVRQLCWVLTIQGLETYLLRAARSGGHRSAGGSHPPCLQPR